jgi:ABC-type sugar transport system ATPase subunit
MSTIELRQITKRFGSFTAVRDVDLVVSAGEIVCLLGPSGCGKTTTLRIIAGLERPNRGDVVIAGKRMTDFSPKMRNIAMVFQFYVTDLLHLEGVLDRLPGQISEGEKQRVAVARAVVRDPNCFLFDEPLSRLDIELRQSMRGQIKTVLTGLSKATVIVTHDQLEALTMADRIAIMRDGVVEQVASPHEVFARPANVFVAGFIGTPQMNLLEAQFEGIAEGKASFNVEGSPVWLEVDPAVRHLPKGKVTIGIRPRALVPNDAASPEALTSRAELIEPMGAETLVHARIGTGSDIRVVVPREARIRTGETLHLKTDARQAHVFDGKGNAVRT